MLFHGIERIASTYRDHVFCDGSTDFAEGVAIVELVKSLQEFVGIRRVNIEPDEQSAPDRISSLRGGRRGCEGAFERGVSSIGEVVHASTGPGDVVSLRPQRMCLVEPSSSSQTEIFSLSALSRRKRQFSAGEVYDRRGHVFLFGETYPSSQRWQAALFEKIVEAPLKQRYKVGLGIEPLD